MKKERRTDNRNIPVMSQSFARGLLVLEAIAFSSSPMGIRGIARQIGLANSIAQRLVTTLSSRGYLEQDEATRRYRLGYRVFEVGSRYISYDGLIDASMPELRQLADEHGFNSFLGVLRDNSVIYLATLQSRGPITLRRLPGDRACVHSTALGKALLAELSDAEVRALLGSTELPHLTPRTKCDVEALLADVRKARRLGYSVVDGENLPGVFSVGAAIRDGSGRAVAAISVAALRTQVPRMQTKHVCELVAGSALGISRRLGSTYHSKSNKLPKTGGSE